MTLNCGNIWASVSEVIRQRISADGYERWFQGVDVVSDDGLKLVIDQARRNAKVTREVMPAEVADLTFLREAQAELGIKGR